MKISVPLNTPRNWSARRAKYLLRRVRREPRASDGIVTAFRDGQVTLRSNRREDGFTNAELEIGYQGIRTGDLVVHGMDAFAGAIGVSESDGKASPVVHAYVPTDDCEPRYYAYLLRHLAHAGFVESLAKGIRQRSTAFDGETLGSLLLPLPELTTQRQIADYLDTETARIDALITKKQRMITLLHERQAELERTAVIGGTTTSTNAVVPTGNQLIPILPATWRLVRARFLCSIETGSSDTDENSATGTYPFFVRSQTPQLSDRFIFDTEAVLTAGDGAGVGKVFHHFRGKFDAHQRVYVLHEFREVEARFFYYCFSAYFALAALDGSAKSTVDSVRRHMITEFPVPVPPREEQTRLVNFLDTTRVRTERLVDLVTKELGLLRERRHALIIAAVTGELDVPGVAA